MSEPASKSVDLRPVFTEIAARLAGFMARIAGYAEDALEPEEDPARRPSNMMLGAKNTLILQVRRMEYTLRCFILWLAAELLQRARDEPGFADGLTLTPRVARPAHPNDPPPNTWMIEQDQALRDALSDRVRLNSFSIATPCPNDAAGRKPRRWRARYKYLPDDREIVDAGAVLARLARLPKLLQRADKMAERLAARVLHMDGSGSRVFARDDDFSLTLPCHPGSPNSPEHALCEPSGSREQKRSSPERALCEPSGSREQKRSSPERALCEPSGSREQNKSSPEPASSRERSEAGSKGYSPERASSQAQKTPIPQLYFEPLIHWLPPDELWRNCADEAERDDLNSLHYRARSALVALGVFPEAEPPDLPGFERFKPPDPPQIRSFA
ncbi:hypothetical protein [Ponticaulis profundi]|uniref:Uncharacterized protein n=1 Tax=Ponticaulis profundi TaxID=2665222 RepID=A0ABW1SAH5_9PROT